MMSNFWPNLSRSPARTKCCSDRTTHSTWVWSGRPTRSGRSGCRRGMKNSCSVATPPVWRPPLRDAKVRAALEHWAPRFVAQGVDYNDFARTVARVGRWEEWLDAWVATANVHARLARDAEAQGWRVTAGEAHLQAALCYHFANFVWMVDKRKHRAAAKKAVAALRLAHRLLDPTAERVEVP